AGVAKQAILLKEFHPAIHFNSRNGGANFYSPNGEGRKIELHGNDIVVLPTDGSTDLLGGNNTNANRSEVNKTGLGGGCLLSFDGINFGIEVCRDHCVDRL